MYSGDTTLICTLWLLGQILHIAAKRSAQRSLAYVTLLPHESASLWAHLSVSTYPRRVKGVLTARLDPRPFAPCMHCCILAVQVMRSRKASLSRECKECESPSSILRCDVPRSDGAHWMGELFTQNAARLPSEVARPLVFPGMIWAQARPGVSLPADNINTVFRACTIQLSLLTIHRFPTMTLQNFT